MGKAKKPRIPLLATSSNPQVDRVKMVLCGSTQDCKAQTNDDTIDDEAAEDCHEMTADPMDLSACAALVSLSATSLLSASRQSSSSSMIVSPGASQRPGIFSHLLFPGCSSPLTMVKDLY